MKILASRQNRRRSRFNWPAAPTAKANGKPVESPAEPGEAEYYRQAAEEGNAWSQFLLGMMYSNGDGVSPDDVEAYMWFTVALVAGDSEAFQVRNTLGHRMSPQQIQTSLRRAWQLVNRIHRPAGGSLRDS